MERGQPARAPGLRAEEADTGQGDLQLWSADDAPLFDVPEVPIVTWFKVDDQLAHHPKVMKADNASMGLWVRAGSWAAAHLTDGFVPASLLPTLSATRKQAETLVKAGLWIVEPEGWRFHDWSIYQPSAHTVKLVQARESEAGSRGNHIRWHVRKGVKDPGCRFCTPSSEES